MSGRKIVSNTQPSSVGKSRLARERIRRAAIETLECRTLLTVVISPVAALPAINEGTALNNVEVATFTDSAGALAPLQYAASINWGDGTTATAGTVVNTSGNNFEVFGSHAYSEESVPGPAYNVSVSVARGDLLTNPGFELPVGFGSYASIPGWTLAAGTGGGTIEIAGSNIGTPYEGNQFTELNSSAPATISQTVSTSPGQTYTFGFAFSARPGTTAADNDMQVSVGGSPIATITADGSSLSNTSWKNYTFSYTATSGSTTIQFASLSPAGVSVGGELDAVQFAQMVGDGPVTTTTQVVNEVPITNLAASGAGPVTTFATVGSGPAGLAFDKSGNLYVANFFDNTIDKVTPGGVVTTFISGNGLIDPKGLAFDSSGNLFVANFFHDSIAKYSSAGSLLTSTSISEPDQMVIDSSNNLYVYDGSGNIDKITPAGAVSTYVIGVSSDAGGLAFDGSGNLFVTDFNNNQVDKVPPGGGSFSVFASGFNQPRDLVVDGSGNLYVSNGNNNSISKVTSGGSVSTYVSGGPLNYPYALALDASGNLYATSFDGNTVVEVPRPLPVMAGSGGAVAAITGIATFTDPAGAEAVADYSTTINWGDGTTSPGTVVNTGGNNFRIDAPAHTYAANGTYGVTVAVTHETAPTQTVPAAVVTVPALQPTQVTADQDNNGDVQISFPAPAINGLLVTYQVMRSVNGGAYANVGSPIASTGAASYTFQDPGPLVDGSSYTYEVSASDSATPPTASNTIEYFYNPLVSHPAFSSTETDLRFNNGAGAPAAINDVNQVQLTNNTGGEANSVYAANPVQINGNWQTSFDFQISNPGADGLTFVIQAKGSSAVGQSGGALGYTGTNNVAAGGITDSIAFAFNQYDSVTQTAFGGDVTGAGATLAPYIGMDGTLGNAFHPAGTTTDLFQVSLSYDSTTGNFYEVVRDTATGLGFTNTYTPAYYTAFNSTITRAALNSLFSGADGALYAGFTGATGGVSSTQTIDDWTFNTTQGAPVAVQPFSISANEDANGNVQISFPAPPTNGVSGVKYQVLRSVNSGAYANLGGTIANTGAADYAVLDFGPFIQRATYSYEVIISGTSPPSPATSNAVQYLYNPAVSHLSFTAGESDLIFNQAGAGDAPTVNAANQLQLSDNTNSDANSVYAANSVQINGNWQTSFSYQITNPGADGFTFVIQSNGSNVTGNSGGGLGYTGGNLSSSLAFAFNQFNGVTQTAMGANGTLAPYITMNGGMGNAFHPAAASTDLFQVSLSYDHLTGNFYEVIRDTGTGQGYSATFTPALYSAYGITQTQVAALFAGPVFVGFTAGTGAVNSIQTIGNWAFNTVAPPLPLGVTASSGAVYSYNSTTNILSLTSGTLTFNNVGTPSSLTLNVTADGSGSNLIFNTTTYLNSLTLTDGATAQLVQSGTDTVTGSGAAATLTSYGTTLKQANTKVLELNSLSIPAAGATFSGGGTNSAQGKLDLTNNAMILNYTGSSAAALASADTLTGDGSDGGVWDGTGITSSNAEADNNNNGYTAIGVADNGDVGYNTFAGQNVSSGTQILFMYTYNGDADLNGTMNVTDTISYEQGLKTHPGGPAGSGWEYGSLDYGATAQGSISDLQFLEAGFRGYKANGAINISES